jgi:hypothetical protein
MTEEPESENTENAYEFKLDRSSLYQEETFTDLKIGTVKRFIPIRPDGTPDKSRKVLFAGQTNIYTPHGPLPIQNVIQAKDLAQAFKRFSEAMQESMGRLVEEANKMKDQKQSPLIQTPDSRIILP